MARSFPIMKTRHDPHLRRVSPTRLDPSLKREILIEQIGNRAQVAGFMVPFGIITAGVFAWYFGGFRSSGDPRITYAFFFLLAAYFLYGVILLFWSRIKEKLLNQKSINKIVPFLYISITTVGIAWSFLVFFSSQSASEYSIGIIYATEIALLSMTIVSPPFKFAMCIWVPLVVCGYTTLYSIDYTYKSTLLIFMTIYAVLTFLSCLSMDSMVFQKSLSTIENRRQAETISILLNEFAEENKNYLWAIDGQMKFCNMSPSLRNMLDGLDPSGEIALLSFPELIHRFIANTPNTTSAEDLLSKITSGDAFRELLVSLHSGTGIRFWSITGRPIRDVFGGFAGYQGYLSDQTDAVVARRELEFLANFDSVTKLLNRHQFKRALRDYTKPSGSKSFALMLIDLDHFKAVNDSLGHSAGDQVLEVVARRLQHCVREGDLVARIGGDEFAILLQSQEIRLITEVGQRIIAAIDNGCVVEGRTIPISASIGIAIWPFHGSDESGLYRNADVALYAAKAGGRNRVSIFGEDSETGDRFGNVFPTLRAPSKNEQKRAS